MSQKCGEFLRLNLVATSSPSSELDVLCAGGLLLLRTYVYLFENAYPFCPSVVCVITVVQVYLFSIQTKRGSEIILHNIKSWLPRLQSLLM